MKPFIVAELSASHCGSVEQALQLIAAAADAGADAVKLQTWHTMTVSDQVIERGPWAGRGMADLYDECRTPWAWHEVIFALASNLGIEAFSTPFDEASVDFLESLGCPRYKIASFEITDLPLIRYVAATGKPIIISTGMATMPEIAAAVRAAKAAPDVTLLHCVSAYPAQSSDYSLATMLAMRGMARYVGVSDHTNDSTVGAAAAVLGADVIEKHIGFGMGPDKDFAPGTAEFRRYVADVRAAAGAVGEVRFGPQGAEVDSLQFRRSVWVTKDVPEGGILTGDNVAVLRPEGGIAPDRISSVIGLRTTRALAHGQPLTEEDFA